MKSIDDKQHTTAPGLSDEGLYHNRRRQFGFRQATEVARLAEVARGEKPLVAPPAVDAPRLDLKPFTPEGTEDTHVAKRSTVTARINGFVVGYTDDEVHVEPVGSNPLTAELPTPVMPLSVTLRKGDSALLIVISEASATATEVQSTPSLEAALTAGAQPEMAAEAPSVDGLDKADG